MKAYNTKTPDHGGEESAPPTHGSPSRSRCLERLQWLGCGLLGAFLILAWLAPSVRYHPDGLDEAALVEASAPPFVAKHPAAEFSVWAVLQLVRRIGIPLGSLRIIQLWNAGWIYLGACAIYLLLLGRTRNALLSLGIAFALGSTRVGLHLVTDPFLMYLPPGLAMFAIAMVIADRGERPGDRARGDGADTRGPRGRIRLLPTGRTATATGWMALAGLFNPMTLMGCPLIAQAIATSPRSDDRNPSSGRRGALLPLVVGFALAVGFYVLRPQERGSPFGHWTSTTVRDSYAAIRDGFVARAPRPGERTPAPGMDAGGGGEFALWLCLASVLLSGLVLLRHALWGKAAVSSRVVYLGTCALCTLVIAWWNPGQPMFWILPWWMLACGAGLVLRGIEHRSANLLGGATIVLALCLAYVNGLRYVLPSTVPDGRIAAARETAASLGPEDFLVMQKWPDNYIRYFGGIRSTGLLTLSMHRGVEESGMDALRSTVERVHRRGGRVYFELPPSEEGLLSDKVRTMGELDFREEQFETLRFGTVLELGGASFREILGVP